jgi:hypothetical protein
VVSPSLVTSPLSLAGSPTPPPETNSPFPASPPSSPHLSPPSPEPFIPPPPPPHRNRPYIGRHYFAHPVNGEPALGIISDPIACLPLWPNGPFVSILSLHLCAHDQFVHLQSFCYCLDVRTGAAFHVPGQSLARVITEEQALTFLAILQARTRPPPYDPGA